MKILQIIPIPFFSIRGTGFSSFNRTKVMSEENHLVDIVTLPYGEDISLPGVRVFRTARLPFFQDVRMGPSLAKLLYNVLLFFKAFLLLVKNKYDCLHVHGEAAYYGTILKILFRKKMLHDLHNSMPADYKNYRPDAPSLLIRFLALLEKISLENSDATIVICPELRETIAPVITENIVTINNFALIPDEDVSPEQRTSFRSRFGLSEQGSLVSYTGSFGTNQSLEIFLESIPLVIKNYPDTCFLMVGGDDDGIARITKIATSLGILDKITILSKKPVKEAWKVMKSSDILVSSMTRGRNVPSKIYSYMAAKRPMVVTDVVPHTQVLDDTMAMIAKPTPDAFAEAIQRLIEDRDLGKRLAEKALAEVEAKYSYTAFYQNTVNALSLISDA